jgi:hypothetical protein
LPESNRWKGFEIQEVAEIQKRKGDNFIQSGGRLMERESWSCSGREISQSVDVAMFSLRQAMVSWEDLFVHPVRLQQKYFRFRGA